MKAIPGQRKPVVTRGPRTAEQLISHIAIGAALMLLLTLIAASFRCGGAV